MVPDRLQSCKLSGTPAVCRALISAFAFRHISFLRFCPMAQIMYLEEIEKCNSFTFKNYCAQKTPAQTNVCTGVLPPANKPTRSAIIRMSRYIPIIVSPVYNLHLLLVSSREFVQGVLLSGCIKNRLASIWHSC